MAEELIVINSGTTFLRTGGELKVKVKSNVTWQFYLYEVAEDTDIESIQSAITMEGETEYYTVIGIDSGKTPTWVHVLNEFGSLDSTTTGENTQYLTIVADENLMKKDLYAVGVVKSEANPDLGDFTVFLSYGKPSYKIIFDCSNMPVGEQTVTVHTPYQVQYSQTGITYKFETQGDITIPITPENEEHTIIPFEIYTTTPCTITMEGVPLEYTVPTGSSINSSSTISEQTLTYYFKVPTNKTVEDIEYNIKAVSREDDTIVEFYKVTYKGMTAKVILSPSNTTINYNDKQFQINYTGIPSTMMFNLNVHSGDTDDRHIVHTLPSCNGSGTLSYQVNENEILGNRTFYIVAVPVKDIENFEREPQYAVVGQGGAPSPGIYIDAPSTISSTDSSFVISYTGTPITMLFSILVGGNVITTVAGTGSCEYNCGINPNSTPRTFIVTAESLIGTETGGPIQVTQGAGSSTRRVTIYFDGPLIAEISDTDDIPRDITITFTLNDGSYGQFSTSYNGYGLYDGRRSLDGDGQGMYEFQTSELDEIEFGIDMTITNEPGSTGYWIVSDSGPGGYLEGGEGGFYNGGANKIVTRIYVPAGNAGSSTTIHVKPVADIDFNL